MVRMRSSNLWGGIAIFLVVLLAGGSAVVGNTIYVDDDGPADFNNIQAAISDANDGDTVLVADGTYTGPGNLNIDFLGKAITVRSENGPENCIIDSEQQGCGFYLHTSENTTSVIDGFSIVNGIGLVKPDSTGWDIPMGGGILCLDSSPTIRNCSIFNNGNTDYFRYGGSGGGIYSEGSAVIENCKIFDNYAWCGGGIYCTGGSPRVRNCIIRGNGICWGAGVSCVESGTFTNCLISGNRGGSDYSNGGASGGHFVNCVIANNLVGSGLHDGTATNCILWGNILWDNSPSQASGSTVIDYSNVQGGWPGEGNIDADPCFADPGYWDPNGTPEYPYDDFFVPGDYHLKSQGGRYDPNIQTWVYDDVTSPCIDVGDSMTPIGAEPFPNGGVVNMGAYGATEEACKSYFGEPPCETIVAGDINGDCEVDFVDFSLMALHWCESGSAEPTMTYQIGECTGRSDSKAQLTTEPTRFSVEVQGSYIHFEDVIPGNCCAEKLELQTTLEDDLIILFEDEYLDSPCRCMCSYPTSATLGPFDDGTYRLDVYKREFVGGQAVFTISVGSTTITIGPG